VPVGGQGRVPEAAASPCPSRAAATWQAAA
jgi:hypothetical protein